MYIIFKLPYSIGSVPSLSGHAIAYQWRLLPRVRLQRANSPQGSSSNGCCHFAGHHGPINVHPSFPRPLLVRSGHVDRRRKVLLLNLLPIILGNSMSNKRQQFRVRTLVSWIFVLIRQFHVQPAQYRHGTTQCRSIFIEGNLELSIINPTLPT